MNIWHVFGLDEQISLEALQRVFAKGWQLMIFGNVSVRGLNIRLLNSVKTCLFSAVFQVFLRFDHCWVIYLANIYVYPADICWYSAEIFQICNWNLVNFSWYSFIVPLISDIYPWYPVYRFPGRRYPLVFALSSIHSNVPRFATTPLSYCLVWYHSLYRGIIAT